MKAAKPYEKKASRWRFAASGLMVSGVTRFSGGYN
jgi:hypothetical protein